MTGIPTATKNITKSRADAKRERRSYLLLVIGYSGRDEKGQEADKQF